MGYEKGITSRWRAMVLDGEYGDTIPGYPKTPDQPGRGTPNHQVLAHLARLTWALEKGTPEQQKKELDAAVKFYDDQVENGFMSRGRVTEQLSPSHSQWWLTATLGLRWLGWQVRDSKPEVSRKLLDVTGRWLRHHHALCKLFATRDGIVAPGARAWPQPEPESGETYYGKCKPRDLLYELIETGRIQKRFLRPENLDMLGLVFADRLLQAGDDFGGAKEATELPKLKWPMSYRRKGSDFTAWLTRVDDSEGLTPQRLASWKGGQESYGFEDAMEDELEGAMARVVGERPDRGRPEV